MTELDYLKRLICRLPEDANLMTARAIARGKGYKPFRVKVWIVPPLYVTQLTGEKERIEEVTLWGPSKSEAKKLNLD